MKNTKRILLSSCLTFALVISSSSAVFASEGISPESETLELQVLEDTTMVEHELTEEDLQHKQIFDQIQRENAEAEQIYESQELELNKESTSTMSETRLDSKVQPLSITKSFLREQWNLGAGILIAGGYNLSGTFLRNSLMDYPSDLKYHHGSYQANSIQYSSEFQRELMIFRSQLPKNGSTYYSRNGSFALSANRDHYLSLHNVNSTFAAQKVGTGWVILATVRDTYNFEYWKYGNGSGLSGNFVSLVNNYAVDSQKLGAIVPYNIYIYMTIR